MVVVKAHMYLCMYVLMKGENDHDNYSWPFEHEVKCRILNWKRDESHNNYDR